MANQILIENLPFYWRLSPPAAKSGNVVADRMPFEFDLDVETGAVIQKRNKSVLDALEVVYRQEYNIGYLQDGNEIAKPYGVDFIRYLKSTLIGKSGQRILEIGCGGCVVLANLKSDGHNVLGLDSSPFAASQGEQKGISVVTGFYPEVALKDKFDLIFHVDVLEHIDNPVEFLRAHHANLNDAGLVVVNVPDATESIEIGDISMAMHQHLNYFTEDSLKATLEHAGYSVESIEKAKYGGSLYATGRRVSGKIDKPQNLCALQSGFEAFQTKAGRILARFKETSKRLLRDGNCQLGYYVPLRTLPYISAAGIYNGFRFFDDTAHWHKCEFDGVDVEVENFQDLKKNPVKHIIVMSLTFGDVIKRKINQEFGQSIQVITLAELASDAMI